MKTGEAEQARGLFFGRNALVAAQIAGAMILLVLAAGGRSRFHEILGSSPGFRKDHRSTMRINASLSGYMPQRAEQFYERLVQKVTGLTGVKSAAVANRLPLTTDWENQHVIPEGYEFPPGRESAEVLTYVVDEGFFETMGVPILEGRGFRVTDGENAPLVVLVNEAFAQQYLGPNPVGKRLRLKERGGQLAEVVGVTATGKSFLLIEAPVQAIYLPMRQSPRTGMVLVAETVGEPASIAESLRRAAQSIDPRIPISRVRTMEDLFERSSVSTLRLVYRIYDSAAILGLLLAVVGLYAVISYQVGRRTREIGIRMALGAGRPQVVAIFIRQGGVLGVTGVVVGVALSWYANRLTGNVLGSAKLDPLLLAAVAVTLLATALAASTIPARKAARIDPQKALRQD
jgi:predicted permease